MTAPTTKGSIRQRLLILLLVNAAVVGLLLYLVVQSVARQIAQESQDNILAASAISILDSARVTGGEISIDLPYSALSMLDSVTDERAFYAIRLNDEFLSGYENLPRPGDYVGGNTVFQSAAYLGEDVRIASTRRSFATDQGQAFLEISVAQTLTGMNRTLTRISSISFGVGIGFFVLSALMAMLIARSTTRPLHRLTASVSRRGPSDLSPVAAPVPSEMAPLVSSLNNFMSRLQLSLSRSEDFIAEAAHRVRTPLAIVRTQAEITLRRVEKPENRQAVREMIRAIDESSRTAGQLLDHAMVSFRTDHLSNETVNLDVLAQETVERLQPLSELREVEVKVVRLDPAAIRGDSILLQSALLNLLDNALKYSSRDSSVEVSVEKDDTEIRIEISDTGPGFPDLDSGQLLERFARGANAEGVVGSGLGLTIVDEVVRAHGGTLTLSNKTGGGACVVLSFPLG
ncbi:sensor histidine kinase [Actibacterium pelagium]|uniref:histidine kinase n=1 Tax=Actibacterium pelagium TaxID=2029103 RepID=A0A917EKN0_9RHOB|nr:sensor histidine kinase [Actibacterium pelagium]GGE54363.1 sensor histidine kinase [Actibacterium pelagium]